MQTLLLISVLLGIAGASICLGIKVSLAQHQSRPRRMGITKK